MHGLCSQVQLLAAVGTLPPEACENASIPEVTSGSLVGEAAYGQ